jgi:hypothetical protein
MTDGQHVITITDRGWSLLHPPTCGDDCPVHRAVRQLRSPPCTGRHPCHLDDAGLLRVDCDRNVWLDSDRPSLDLLPNTMSRIVDRTAEPRREDHTPLVRDGFHPWR